MVIGCFIYCVSRTHSPSPYTYMYKGFFHCLVFQRHHSLVEKKGQTRFCSSLTFQKKLMRWCWECSFNSTSLFWLHHHYVMSFTDLSDHITLHLHHSLTSPLLFFHSSLLSYINVTSFSQISRVQRGQIGARSQLYSLCRVRNWCSGDSTGTLILFYMTVHVYLVWPGFDARQNALSRFLWCFF